MSNETKRTVSQRKILLRKLFSGSYFILLVGALCFAVLLLLMCLV